ncbi:MAG: monodechloroaminopyrrolnitrin synthase PrnB family protein [Patescibacteria group bacterium]
MLTEVFHSSGLDPRPEPRHGYTSYEDVASIDPLELDQQMRHLPGLNSRADVEAIWEGAADAVTRAEALPTLTPALALAALRDLDFLSSSILRHGQQPLEIVPGLEAQLLRMGESANTPPRMTLFTYTVANPEGERRRSFTGTEEETVFIDSLARSVVALDGTVENMAQANFYSDGNLQGTLGIASQTVDVMIDSIIEVKRKIMPQLFTFQIRPYFEPLVIGEQTIPAASGAQMQFLALDRMLWGCDDDDPAYQVYFEENYPYLTPVQKDTLDIFLKHNGGRSIVGLLSEKLVDFPDSIEVATGILKKMRKFRYAHRQVARQNFSLRPNGATGSGTYSPAILDILLERTEASIVKLRNTTTG